MDEVAAAIHVHPNTVRHWSDRGLLKAYRLGPRRDRRFSPEDIDSFINHWDQVQESVRSRRGKVLVVGDDPGVRGLLVDVVRQQGCSVIAVPTGASAMKQIEKRRFDLILLDLVTLEFSGERVLEAIRARDNTTIVAVLVADGDVHMALKVVSKGFVFLIRKPFEPTDIIEVMHVAMRAQGKG